MQHTQGCYGLHLVVPGLVTFDAFHQEAAGANLVSECLKSFFVFETVSLTCCLLTMSVETKGSHFFQFSSIL